MPIPLSQLTIPTTLQRDHARMQERLRTQGIRNPAVLEAMYHVPRHLFVDEALSTHAYADHPLPIGQGQTISQPYIVARMTELLLGDGYLDSVLEIGTGCGYQTAVLAQLVGKVYTVERIKNLADKARERLEALGLTNIQFNHGDGYLGWADHAPYQGIIVTAAPEAVPDALLNQLAVGGHLIIPVGPTRSHQELLKIVRTRARYEQSTLDAVVFVPLQPGII